MQKKTKLQEIISIVGANVILRFIDVKSLFNNEVPKQSEYELMITDHYYTLDEIKVEKLECHVDAKVFSWFWEFGTEEWQTEIYEKVLNGDYEFVKKIKR